MSRPVTNSNFINTTLTTITTFVSSTFRGQTISSVALNVLKAGALALPVILLGFGVRWLVNRLYSQKNTIQPSTVNPSQNQTAAIPATVEEPVLNGRPLVPPTATSSATATSQDPLPGALGTAIDLPPPTENPSSASVGSGTNSAGSNLATDTPSTGTPSATATGWLSFFSSLGENFG